MIDEHKAEEWKENGYHCTVQGKSYAIAPHMMQGLCDYILHGIPTGGFLEAVLSNDLVGAIGRADSFNIANLPAYAVFLRWEAPAFPAPCWGAQEHYDKWIEAGGLQGKEE